MNTALELTETTIDLVDEGLSINRAAFERFVDVMDYRTVSDDHGFEFQIDWQDYYDTKYIMEDIKEFMTAYNPVTGEMKNIADLGCVFRQLMEQINQNKNLRA